MDSISTYQIDGQVVRTTISDGGGLHYFVVVITNHTDGCIVQRQYAGLIIPTYCAVAKHIFCVLACHRNTEYADVVLLCFWFRSHDIAYTVDIIIRILQTILIGDITINKGVVFTNRNSI